jgi:hypothetical protein
MHDVRDVLERALDGLPPAGAPADPEPDLIRGRNLLRRRRSLRAGGAAVVCAAAAIAIAVPVMTHGPAASHPVAISKPRHATQVSVGLVAYPGPQPPGYTVKEIPAGWVIQGSGSFVLTIAPANDTNTNPDSFLGKLIVTWSATAATSADGTPVTVVGRPGYYSDADGTQALEWKDTEGRWLAVQAPTSLGWNETGLAAFAAVVTVLPGAQPSVG